jgi:hypothetical protein
MISKRERIRRAYVAVDETTMDLVAAAERHAGWAGQGVDCARNARVNLLQAARRYTRAVDKLSRVR